MLFPDHPNLVQAKRLADEVHAAATGQVRATPVPTVRPSRGAARGAGGRGETGPARRAGEGRGQVPGEGGSGARGPGPRTELRSPTAGSAARAGPSQARTASPAPPAGSTAGAGPSQARTASQSPTEELHALLKRRIPTSRAEEEELAEVLRILASPQQQARLAIEEFHRNLLRRFGGARQDIAEPSVASSRPPQSDNPPTS
jgi:hypothetical protein